MKKIISLILVLTIMLSLSACGSLPDGFTKNTYNVTKDAVEVLNSYLDGKSDANATITELDTLAKSLEAEKETISDAAEKSNTTNMAMKLRTIIYLVNRAGDNPSDMDLMSIRQTVSGLEQQLKG